MGALRDTGDDSADREFSVPKVSGPSGKCQVPTVAQKRVLYHWLDCCVDAIRTERFNPMQQGHATPATLMRFQRRASAVGVTAEGLIGVTP